MVTISHFVDESRCHGCIFVRFVVGCFLSNFTGLEKGVYGTISPQLLLTIYFAIHPSAFIYGKPKLFDS